MSRLDDIPVKVVGRGAEMTGPGDANEVLGELARLLAALLEKGESGSIELSELALDDEDFERLEEALGEGEVHGEIHASGSLRFYETGVSGVWWVTHYGDDDEVVAEFLEIGECPQVLLSPKEDVMASLESLRARLFEVHLAKSGRGRK